MKYPRVSRLEQGTVIDLFPRCWIVWTISPPADDEFDSPCYRTVRIVLRSFTMILEWPL